MKYKYEIKPSFKRYSLTLSINAKNEITLYCPYGIRQADLDTYVESKSEWIDKVILHNAMILARNNEVVEHRQIYVEGKMVPLIIGDVNEICDDYVQVKSLKDIPQLFMDTFTEDFCELVYKLADVMLLSPYPYEVTVKEYKTRWGCCDAQKNLIFNYVIFMLPPHLQRYIIVHELCHTLCFNHSPAFWDLVGEFEKDYKREKKELKDYDFLMTVY